MPNPWGDEPENAAPQDPWGSATSADPWSSPSDSDPRPVASDPWTQAPVRTTSPSTPPADPSRTSQAPGYLDPWASLTPSSSEHVPVAEDDPVDEPMQAPSWQGQGVRGAWSGEPAASAWDSGHDLGADRQPTAVVPDPEPGGRGAPRIVEDRDDAHELFGANAYQDGEDEDPGRRRKILIGIGVVAAALLATGAGVAVLTSNQPSFVADPTPTQDAIVTTMPPVISARDELPFGASLAGSESADVGLTNATDGFGKPGSGWTKDTGAEAQGYTGYRQDSTGCTVYWAQRAATFPAGTTDEQASAQEIASATKQDGYEVAEYAYWTSPQVEHPDAHAEVAEARVAMGGKDVIVAARAMTQIGQSSIIWSTCSDPAKLDAFAGTVRSGVGFVLVDRK